ncbi:MAG: gamma-glutamyl-gamma-aminobutyrate hydrolase family protein [Candidatus Lokiarchaeota archaeon]|nr:gamma-glutamyl-gamma-aminobutyrate hydrolase family protein [Candidatus Lokiarchaeota archaeon]
MKKVTIALVSNYPRKDEVFWLSRRKNLVDAIASYPGMPGNDLVQLQHISIRIDDLLSPGTMAELEGADGAILSGSPLNLSAMDGDMREKPFILALEGYVLRARVPILGICFGHQLVGHAFGCRVGKYATPGSVPVEKDAVGVLRVEPSFDLLRRFPGFRDGPVDVSVEWKHQEEVKPGDEFSRQFLSYASTPACRIQAIKHVDRPVYGVQFHPENRKDEVLANGRSPRQDGQAILHGFLDMVVEATMKGNSG